MNKIYDLEFKPYSCIPWSDGVNSTPIEDLRAWQMILAEKYGVYGDTIEMNKLTFEYVRKSQQVRQFVPDTILTISILSQLLYGEPDIIIRENIDKVKIQMKKSSYMIRDVEATPLV